EIKIVDGTYTFKLNSCIGNIDHIELGLPGLHNVENSVAAIAAAQIMGVSASHIQQSLASFTGVNRRFDIRIKTSNFVYIDDYAHHPEEIKAFVNSVKQLFPNKRITGIFQPHLFSRTRDFAAGFSQSLSLLDEAILMDIYPARELPISGVSSEMLMKDIDCNKKQLLNASEILDYLKLHQQEVLVTIGAGDIDKLVEPIENLFRHAKNNQ
ncbi:MAG: glutamate ligase domain-containing protein, partial [Bacteroidota bacterium]